MASHIESQLDKINWRLLWELQEDARQSYTDLAGKVGLCPATVKQRILWLEKQGIITGYHTAVNVRKLGLSIMAFIRVETSKKNDTQVTVLVKEHPEVLECHKVTGEESFILKVAISSDSHLEHLTDLLGAYGDSVSSVVLSTPVPRKSINSETLRADARL